MKRFIVSLLCLAALQAFANPLIAPPPAAISELYFDSSGKWFLELEFFRPIDTVRITTNSGEAVFLSKKAYEKRFVVITCDSVNNHSLIINKTNDCLKVFTRPSASSPLWIEKDSMLIGNQSGSVIDSIPLGCSINNNWSNKTISLDRSPTLGKSNDEDGATSTIYGHFYQLGANFESYNEKFFYFSYPLIMPIELSTMGFPINKQLNYVAKVWSRHYSIENLLFFTTFLNPVIQINVIKNDFAIYPGDSIRVDFTMATSLKLPARQKAFFSNYPNPANDHTSFVFDMPMFRFEKVYIRIYSMDGKLVQTLQPKSAVYDFDCRDMNLGTYICKMEHSGVTVATTKLLIVR